MSIEIKNLSFSYNKKKIENVLECVSFSIPSNDVFALIGPTGAGKSTLAKIIDGLLLPSNGEIIFSSDIIKTNEQEASFIINNKSKNSTLAFLRSKIGLVLQFPEQQLFENTILKDVMFGPKNYGFSDEKAKEAAINALKAVGIDESFYEKSPFEISGGEKRRVAIAGILAFSPNVIIFDEPTVGLDPLGKKTIYNLISTLNKMGKTIVLITHDLDCVMSCAKHVAILEDKKVSKIVDVNKLIELDTAEFYSSCYNSFFAFQKLLIKYGFNKKVENVRDIKGLVDLIAKEKHHE